MIYKFTITFKVPSEIIIGPSSFPNDQNEPLSTIMYISRTSKDKVFQKLTAGIELDPTSQVGFVSQQNEFIEINTTYLDKKIEEGTIEGFITENVPEEERELWLITQNIAINTTNVAKVQVQAQ